MSLKKFVRYFNPDTEAIRLGAVPADAVEEMPEDWVLCISIARDVLSTSWKEYFFCDVDNADAFARLAFANDWSVLEATPDEY